MAQASVDDVVRGIIEQVRSGGDEALIECMECFDDVVLSRESLRVSAEEIEAARCEQEVFEALELAAQRISAFHKRQMPQEQAFQDEVGVTVGTRWRAVSSVGLYVPGGTASYPSSVLMSAIPARLAGVGRVVMVTPSPGALVLVAARLAGVEEVYRIGGAQAIAALVFGTQTVPRVDKVVGPGNAYVTAAKRLLSGEAGMDAEAGPSEILVVADKKNEPKWIAADLISQAEHDSDAQSILVSDSEDFARAVAEEVDVQLESLPRREIAAASWKQHGAVIIVGSFQEAIGVVNQVAPEHLLLAVESPERLLRGVVNAGTVFLGSLTPEVIGDYVAGTNHVLPTGRRARYSSGLSVFDFLKRISVVACSRRGLENLGPSAVSLARAEGLEAHARSVTVRLGLP